jgi:hypothetical protein
MAAKVTQAQERAAEFEREALALQGELTSPTGETPGKPRPRSKTCGTAWPTPPPSFVPVTSRSARCVKMAPGLPTP